MSAIGATPENDSFNAPYVLPPIEGEILSSNLAGTRESNEPALPGAPVGKSIWFRWTAPGDGLLTIEIPAQTQPIVMAVAPEASLPSLQWKSSNAYRFGRANTFVWRSRTAFSTSVRAGSVYRIAADTQEEDPFPDRYQIQRIILSMDPLDSGSELLPPPDPFPGGDVQFVYHFTAAPENDAFARATTISGLSNLVHSVNFAATTESGEPAHPDSPGGASVWYSWTAPISGRVSVGLNPPPPLPEPSATVTLAAKSPEGIFYEGGSIQWTSGGSLGLEFEGLTGSYYYSNYGPGVVSIAPADLDPPPVFAPILSIYEGSDWSTLNCMGRGTNNSFDAVAGHSYRISFEGANNTFGAVDFYMVQTPPPLNDDFVNAIPISDAASATLSGHLVSATREVGEANFGPAFGGGSVWYRWNAPSYGTIRFQNVGSNYYPIAVYRGNALTNLSLVAQSTNNAVVFFGEEGVSYSLSISSGDLAPGPFDFSIVGPMFHQLTTNATALVRDGYVPRLERVRGVSALLYAHKTNGWECVEIEPIRDQSATFVNSLQNTGATEVKIVTLEEEIPAPRVEFELEQGELRPFVVGYPGQNCEIAFSPNLADWTRSAWIALASARTRIAPCLNDANGKGFYRVRQFLPSTLLPSGVTYFNMRMQETLPNANGEITVPVPPPPL